MKKYLLLGLMFVSTICHSSELPDFDELMDDDYYENVNGHFDSLTVDEIQPDINIVSNETIETIICTENDVLMGRGSRINNHPGNIKFRNFIKANRHVYQSLAKRLRTQMAKDFLQILKNEGVRFLRFDDMTQSWHEVSDERARQKISQCLREKSHSS